MPKLIAVILVFALVSSAGCGKKEEDEVTREPEITQKAPEPISEEAEAIPQEEPEIEIPVKEPGPKYVIQVASWERLEDAVWMADWMSSIGYDAWVETAYIPSKAMEYHRVRTGSFNYYNEAMEGAIRISKRIGSGYWVVKVY